MPADLRGLLCLDETEKLVNAFLHTNEHYLLSVAAPWTRNIMIEYVYDAADCFARLERYENEVLLDAIRGPELEEFSPTLPST